MIEPDPTAIRLVTACSAQVHNADVMTDIGAGQIPLAAMVLECTGPGSDGAHALGFWIQLEVVAELVAALQAVLAEPRQG